MLSRFGDLVVAVLEEANRPLGFDALDRRLPGDAEALDEALTTLQADGRVCYHAGRDGYALPTWTFDALCAACGEPIPDGEHYCVTIRHQHAAGADTRTVRLHPGCADSIPKTE